MKKSLLLTLIKTSRIGTGISDHAEHREHRVSTLHRPRRFLMFWPLEHANNKISTNRGRFVASQIDLKRLNRFIRSNG